jgi:hypothetical protein
MIVASPFGVYAASYIQKIQLVFLQYCSDESSTRTAVQRLFEWLEQWGEAPRLSERAVQRARVVGVLADVNQTGSPTKKQPQTARSLSGRPRAKHA